MIKVRMLSALQQGFLLVGSENSQLQKKLSTYNDEEFILAREQLKKF
ncbi:hypothetical protein [Gelidibacter salicanalis]|nr:hypothetical protein [Gelidibacter salicanalis]